MNNLLLNVVSDMQGTSASQQCLVAKRLDVAALPLLPTCKAHLRSSSALHV